MTKREIKTQAIIDTAFRVWGDKFFYNTSLSSLAEALGMTKPGLYRYFKNKEALLLAMEQDFISKYHFIMGKTQSINNPQMDSLLINLTEILIRFFAENYYYYRFFVLKLLNRYKDINLLNKAMKVEGNHFLSAKLSGSYSLSELDAQVVYGYMQSVAGFLLNQKLFSKSLYTKPEINQLIRISRFISLYGLGGHGNKSNSIDYSSVELSSAISKEDILPFNRIFAAIADVIAEKGIWETTIDSIAEHLGMSRSSLYFYFENKDQMIKDVIGREIEHLNNLITSRIVKYESYKEQIYCIFHVMSSYFILKPSIFSIMNWLRFQFIDKPIKPKQHKFEKFTGYIELLTNNSSFNPIGFSPDLIARGLNFILIRELWDCVSNEVNIENINIRLRKIHGLCMNGLKGSWK